MPRALAGGCLLAALAAYGVPGCVAHTVARTPTVRSHLLAYGARVAHASHSRARGVAATATVFDWAEPTVNFVSIAVDQSTGVRGLRTTRACKLGDVVLEVRAARALSDASADAPSSLPGTPERWAWSLPPQVQLALALIAEQRRGSGSAWAPYLASLPDPPPLLPKDLQPEQLAAAQDERFEADADAAFCAIHMLCDDALEAWGEAADVGAERTPPCTHAEFQRAMTLVWTRCLRLDLGADLGVRRLMVPCVDMANHAPVPSAFFASGAAAADGAPTVRLVAARDLGVGEELTLSYAEESSAHFAAHYGFVPADNPYDALDVDARELAPLRAAHAAGWPADEPFALPRTGVDCELFGALRYALAAETASAAAALRGAPSAAAAREAYAAEPLAPELEARVAECVADACERRARAAPTTLAEDRALSDGPGGAELDDATRLLLALRTSRKELLDHVARSMREYARAQREAAARRGAGTDPAALGDADEAGVRAWRELVGRVEQLSTFPQLDKLGIDVLQSMIASATAPALLYAFWTSSSST